MLKSDWSEATVCIDFILEHITFQLQHERIILTFVLCCYCFCKSSHKGTADRHHDLMIRPPKLQSVRTSGRTNESYQRTEMWGGNSPPSPCSFCSHDWKSPDPHPWWHARTWRMTDHGQTCRVTSLLTKTQPEHTVRHDDNHFEDPSYHAGRSWH